MKHTNKFTLLLNVFILMACLKTAVHAMPAGERKSPAAHTDTNSGDSKRASAAAPAANDSASIADDSNDLDLQFEKLTLASGDKIVVIQAIDYSIQFSLASLKRHSKVAKTMVEDRKLTPEEVGKELTELLEYPPQATLRAFKTVLEAFDKDKELFICERIQQTIPVLDRINKESLGSAKGNPNIVYEIFKIAHALDVIKPIKILCSRWFVANPDMMCTLMWKSDFPADCMEMVSEEYSLHVPTPRVRTINFRILQDHYFFPECWSFSDAELSASKTPEEQAIILFQKLRDSKKFDSVITEMPTSKVTGELIKLLPSTHHKDLLIETFIAENCTNPDFDFLFWYEQLSPGRGYVPAATVRTRVVDTMERRAKEFIGVADRKTPDIEVTLTKLLPLFPTLPEGYFKMLVRKKFASSYPTTGKSFDLRFFPCIVELGIAIYTSDGLNDFTCNHLTSFAGIGEWLVVKNELFPIRNVGLTRNKNLTTATIPAALTALEKLDLSDNGLTTITIPETLTALKELNLSGNNFGEDEKRALRARFGDRVRL